MLSKEIDKRPQSASVLASELRHIGELLDVRAGDPPRTELHQLDEDSGRAPWLAIVLVILAIAVVLWWILR